MDYVNRTISFVEPPAASGQLTLPSIPPFPWGKGRPQAELLHRGSTKEEQDAVLEEELCILYRIAEPLIRFLVKKYIHLFYEANKSGWTPSKWEPYELEWAGSEDEWEPVRGYFYPKTGI
jgi:hypothetical protein